MRLGEHTRVAARLVRSTLALLVVFAIVVASAGATFPGRPGRIAWAYAANDPNYHLSPDYGIRTVGPSGKAERTLVACFSGDPNGNSITCPQYSGVSYSADGAHLVWAVTTASGGEELVVAKANGGNQTVITHPGENDFEPSFSPRGNRLVYVRSRPGVSGRQIVTSDLVGSNVRLITTISGSSPKFSPDGRRVLFIRGYSVWVVDANGHAARRLTRHAVGADWAPNGKSIVVVTPYGLLRTIHADGTGVVTLHVRSPNGPGAVHPSFAVFSPDGKSIAFDSSDPTTSPTIYTVTVGGGRARAVDSYFTDDEGALGSDGLAGLSWQARH